MEAAKVIPENNTLEQLWMHLSLSMQHLLSGYLGIKLYEKVKEVLMLL